MLGRSGPQVDVNSVFTPRKTDVNPAIYVPRDDLELALKRAIRGAMHVVVYGESGSGKSWLYKKVLADLSAAVFSANSSNALRLHSLTNVICEAVGLGEQLRLSGMEEEKRAGLNVGVADGGLSSTRQYTVQGVDPLLRAFEAMRARAQKRDVVLVIDNLELILQSEALMNELAAVITLLDDEKFSPFRVKLLLVGVPSVVRDYFARTVATQSVANRLQEVPEVSALTRQQVDLLVVTGFRDLLNVEVAHDVLSTWQSHIYVITMGYAQAVQEYCEQLAYVVQDSEWRASAEQLKEADAAWLRTGLSAAQVAVASRMNERETRRGRRNQVLYALGKVDHRSFTAQEVEAIVRREFPESTADTTLAVGQLLGELAGGDDPLVKQTARGTAYEFRDARRAMALRVLLQKESERERVRRVTDPL